MRSTVLLVLLIAAIAATTVWLWSRTAPAPSAVMSKPATAPTELTDANEPLLPKAKTRRASQPNDWFREVTPESAIQFRHVSGDTAEKPFPAANGSGLGALDFDRDGRLDLFFATGVPLTADYHGGSAGNQLYRNLGEWKFTNVSAFAGIQHHGYSAGVCVGDFDSDGFPDVYVTQYGPNRMYWNRGDGTFEEVGAELQVADSLWGTSAAFFDHDLDGHLDLYVCNYGEWTLETNQYCGDRERGLRMFCSPTSIQPQPDVFLHNEGNGSFADRSEATGIAARKARAQGVIAADVSGDGRVDLYLGNDLHPNTLLICQPDGTFHDASEASGTAYDARGNAQAGMGVDVADVTGDGLFDIFVTNFQNENNCLYENVGEVFFHEASYARGLANDSIPWVGWGTAVTDFDLDGWPDVLVTNGHVDNNRHLIGQDAPFAQPPMLWVNQRGNFQLLGESAGDYFSVDHVGRGLIVGDFDLDGDLDVVVSHQDTLPGLLENQKGGTEQRSSIVLRLVGTRSNRDAVGTLVRFQTSTRTSVTQIKGGGSYQSASDLSVVLAVLPSESEYTISIRWPDGDETLYGANDLARGRSYIIVQGSQPTSSVVKEFRE